ncbi:VIT1/CCC1 transporter family protein [Lactobacillaceae bacterium Melli_B4]
MKQPTLAQKINVIRASVMGANDGILSVAGIVIGVAGATANSFAIFISGIAGMIAGTVSMAMGEWVSVSTEKDSQRNAINNQKHALKHNYQQEFDTVKQKYIDTGINAELAEQATKEMMDENPLVTTIREKYGFNVNEFTSPYAAAIASMISFPTGSILPLAAIALFPSSSRVSMTFIAVVIALAITGYSAAILSKANRTRSVLRNIISGMLTMVVTYLIGKIIGTL